MNLPTFAKTPSRTQKNTSAKASKPGGAVHGHYGNMNPIHGLQRTIGNQAIHRLLTCEPPHALHHHAHNPVKGPAIIQREEAARPQHYSLADGRVVVNNFLVENSPWPGHPDRADQTASIDLAFTPAEGGRFSTPGAINWFQTVRTNSRGGSEPVRPEDQYPVAPPVQFVDGYLDRGPDRQRARLWNTPSLTFRDNPGRHNLPDRVTTWHAETSCVGISAQGHVRLITFTWGFSIDQAGHGQESTLTPTTSPSAYHMQKFGELPRP